MKDSHEYSLCYRIRNAPHLARYARPPSRELTRVGIQKKGCSGFQRPRQVIPAKAGIHP